MTMTVREQEIRQALEQILNAADAINDPDENGAARNMTGHNDAQQGLILQTWEQLAVLTGNQDLAKEKGFKPPDPAIPENFPAPVDWMELQREEPVSPLHRLTGPFQAMGAAMFHINAALLDYGLVQGTAGTDSSGDCINPVRYLRTEHNARIAHAILHRAHEFLSYRHPRGPEIRKHCRQANIRLTRERSIAAALLGIDPPPAVSPVLRHEDMDWDHREIVPE